MKICVAIPTYNHSAKLDEIISELPEGVAVVVVDDGSCPPIRLKTARASILRIDKNMGKANALKTAFADCRGRGFTHVVTMDADGQHPPSCLKDFIEAARISPDSIIVGVRDFENSAIPPARKFLNKFSNFWFRAETGVRVDDTQCGFRCYPLEKVSTLDIGFGGFVFEVELLVRAAWAGVEISQIKIPAIYDKLSLEGSHYKPFSDTLKFTAMNTKLWFMSVFLSKKILKKLSLKK